VTSASSAVGAPIEQGRWAGMKLRRRLAHGLDIAYVELGPPTAPPLLLIHGFTDSSRAWSTMAPHLARRYRLIIPDLRGHGASAVPDCCYALSDFAHDLIGLLDALAIPRAHIAGHSLGGMIAQVLAYQHAERMAKLVLMGTTLSPASAGAGRDGWLWQEVPGLPEPIDPDGAFMRAWFANPRPVDPDFLAHEMREAAAIPKRVWLTVMYEIAASEFGRFTPEIVAPALILHGTADPFFGAEAEAALAAALPSARRVAFEGAGHNMHWEAPQEVAKTIGDFLDGPLSGSSAR
jgi:pimeloyl-ACP methyl ester carboxylesterase